MICVGVTGKLESIHMVLGPFPGDSNNLHTLAWTHMHLLPQILLNNADKGNFFPRNRIDKSKFQNWTDTKDRRFGLDK